MSFLGRLALVAGRALSTGQVQVQSQVCARQPYHTAPVSAASSASNAGDSILNPEKFWVRLGRRPGAALRVDKILHGQCLGFQSLPSAVLQFRLCMVLRVF